MSLDSDILTTPWRSGLATIFVCVATLAVFPVEAQSRVTLTPCHVDGVTEELRCGVYHVFENRHTREGRTLPLKIVVLPARHPHPDPTPIFYLTGGPGETATEMAPFLASWGENEEHDVVLVDERGTGDGHRLDCRSPASDDHLESYFNGPFDPAAARACQQDLSQNYDLSQYTTPAFVEDLEEVRQAMDYPKIHIAAGSFGTYAALMYIRRYGEHVRSAYLTSLVTLSNRVPLYHAQSAQWGLERLFEQCELESACRSAYPRLPEDFGAILDKVREAPVSTWVTHPITGASTEIHMNERAFADGVRVMMYSTESARGLPLLIHRARNGDFSPFADAALRANRGIYGGVRMGLHYAITCNEFVARIRTEEIEPATGGSYLGSWRVESQMAACSEWPKTDLPADYFEPFRSDVPVVLVSGDTDPASPPRWGEEVKSLLRNAVHIIVPGGGHTPDNECTRSIRAELFQSGAVEKLDLGCVTKLRPTPFALPTEDSGDR